MYYDNSGKTEDFVKERMTNFLKSLPADVVSQLVKVSTGGLIHAQNVDEAIGVILRYSDAVTLLNRKVIKKAFLAGYLNSCQIRFSTPPTKTSLSQDVLRHWGIESGSYTFEDEETTPPATRSRQRHDSGVVVNDQSNRPDASIQVLSNVQLPSQEATGQNLALQFVPWFYNMLNTQVDFHAHHFWPKSTLRLEIIGVAPSPIIKEANTGEEACALLKSIVEVEKIHFNPNCLNGVGIRGAINPHGLVEVLACGSAHRENSQFGLFEQMFSLLRDPQFENNFKILNTILRFRKDVPQFTPSISHV